MTLTHKNIFPLRWKRILLTLIILCGGAQVDIRAGQSAAALPHSDNASPVGDATGSGPDIFYCQSDIIASSPEEAACSADTIGIKIYFRVWSSRYEPSFRSNGERVARFVELFNALTEADGLSSGPGKAGATVRVMVSAMSSPEGGADMNMQLSRERFNSARAALAEAGIAADFFSAAVCEADVIGIYPEEAFSKMVKTSPSINESAREEMLSILGDSSLSYPQKIKALRSGNGGLWWRELSKESLPEMRAFSAQVSVDRADDSAPTAAIPECGAESAAQSEELIQECEPEPEEQSEALIQEFEPAPASMAPSTERILHNKLALKSNMLCLGLLMANVGVEFSLSQHLSLHLPLYYSGWDYFSDRVKFRTLAVQPEIRWNFRPTDGLFVGAHTMIAYFNLATGGDYRIQDRSGDTPLLGGGVSLGYRMHFKNNPRWGMEFALGGGAYRFCYDRFVNEKNGPYVDTVNKTYVGLDNVAVSIFYELDLGRGARR